MNRVYIYINGILNFPGSAKNWTGRAVTWTHLHSDFKSEKVEYFCGPIGRAFGQRERADKLHRTCEYYRGWEQIIVGHSNGADVILRMFKSHPHFPQINELHLVCAAANASFNKNGLNSLLRIGRIKQVFVYVAAHDMALRFAHTLPGKILGYGTMGLGHDLHVDPTVSSRVHVFNNAPWTQYGHSDCWHDHVFSATMDNFVH